MPACAAKMASFEDSLPDAFWQRKTFDDEELEGRPGARRQTGASGFANADDARINHAVEAMETDPSDDPMEVLAASIDGLQLGPSRETIGQEAAEMLARQLGIDSAATDDALSNLLGPDETPEQVLARTSVYWQERINSIGLMEKALRGKLVGSDEYDEAYTKYRNARVRTCWHLMKTSPLRPSAVKVSMDWFEKLDKQFPLFPTRYPDLPYFDNLMTHVADDLITVGNPGQSFETMLLVRITCLAAPQFNTKQSLFTLLAGDASTGKSYLQSKCASMLPPGWVIMLSHMSALALSDDVNGDFCVLMIEEAPLTLTQETAEKTGQDGGASFIKCLFTNKICITRTMAYDKGKRTRQVHVTSKMMTGVFATNNKIDATSPLCKRYMVLKPSFDPDIAEKINPVEVQSLSKEQKTAILRQQVLAHLVQVTEGMIGMGAIKPPNMDAFAVHWNTVVKEMAGRGHAMADAKAVIQVQQVVRTLVVMKAVAAAVMSEVNFDLRMDTSNGNAKRFGDHIVEHMANIERLLVCEIPEIVFGISACASIFGDDTESKLLEAARRLLGIEVKDGVVHVTRSVNPMPDRRVVLATLSSPADAAAIAATADAAALMSGAATQREFADLALTYHWQYLELLPQDGRGLLNVARALLTRCTERPSEKNSMTAMLALCQRSEKHRAMIGVVEGNERLIKPDPKRPGVFKGHIFAKREWPADYEQRLLNPDGGGNKVTNRDTETRIYVLLDALVYHQTQAAAMKESLLALQNITTDTARLLICAPLEAPAHRFNPKQMHTFHGLFDYVDFKRNPDKVLYFHSHTALLPLQAADYNPGDIFDGGDETLVGLDGEEIERRQTAYSNRQHAITAPILAITSAIDYDLYMSRQTECGHNDRAADLMYWTSMPELCVNLRSQFPAIFSRNYEGRRYPDDLLREAQERNMQVQMALSNVGSMADKLALVPSFSRITSGVPLRVAAPSLHRMQRVFSSGGIEALRMLFAAPPARIPHGFKLDEVSQELIAENADAQKHWQVTDGILALYQDAKDTASAYMNFAGYHLQFAHNKSVSIRVGSSNRLLMPVTLRDRLTNKRASPSEGAAPSGFDDGTRSTSTSAAAASAPAVRSMSDRIDSNLEALRNSRSNLHLKIRRSNDGETAAATAAMNEIWRAHIDAARVAQAAAVAVATPAVGSNDGDETTQIRPAIAFNPYARDEDP